MKGNTKIKLDIIAGFLGAGKTTLINRLLAEAYTGEKPVLIENEFGKVGIDDSLIEDKEVQVRLLSSGCICCTLKDDFVDGIIQVVNQYSPGRIVIEPTGLADPPDILSVCREAGRMVPVQVNAFITVVNAENCLSLLAAGVEIYKKQISGAKMIVLNRTGRLPHEKLAKTTETIRLLNPKCLIVDQDRQLMDALSILTLAEDVIKPSDKGNFICGDHDCNHDYDHNHTHGYEGIKNITSLAFFPGRVFSSEEMAGLFNVFSSGNNGQILRAKGFLKKAEGGYAHLEYVYGRGEIFDSSYTGLPKFVVIGTGLDRDVLEKLIEGNYCR